MKVIFHIGLPKTGSTFIQDVFRCNFAFSSHGCILYPPPHGDAGNALALARAISCLDAIGTRKELSRLIAEAGDSTVLISNENLYRYFVKPECRSVLLGCLSELGVDDFSFLVVQRNIFEHAVSRYCHFSGIRDVPSFEKWITEVDVSVRNYRDGVTCYEYWAETRQLLAAVKELGNRIHFICYSRQMERSLEDFLGVTLRSVERVDSNPSVSPSEAMALSIMKNNLDCSSFCIGDTRDSLKSVPKVKKADSSGILKLYHECVSEQIATHRELIDRAEELFGFTVSELPGVHNTTTGADVITLSEHQFETIIRSVILHSKMRVQFTNFLRSLLPPPLKALLLKFRKYNLLTSGKSRVK